MSHKTFCIVRLDFSDPSLMIPHLVRAETADEAMCKLNPSFYLPASKAHYLWNDIPTADRSLSYSETLSKLIVISKLGLPTPFRKEFVFSTHPVYCADVLGCNPVYMVYRTIDQ